MLSSLTTLLLVMISIDWYSCHESTTSIPSELSTKETSTSLNPSMLNDSLSQNETITVPNNTRNPYSTIATTATQSSLFVSESTSRSILNISVTSDNTTSSNGFVTSPESSTTNFTLSTGFNATTQGKATTNSYSNSYTTVASESISTINSSQTNVSSPTISPFTHDNTTNVSIATTSSTVNVSSEMTTATFTSYSTTFNASGTTTAKYLPTTSLNSNLSTTVANTATITSSNVSSTTNTNVTTTMIIFTTSNSSTSHGGMIGNDKDVQSSAGVILGAIFGSILGIALVCIVAYILCGSRKTKEISHRRLYEDARSDPVLRLDNPVSPYDVSYGGSSFYNPTAIEELPYNGGRTHETIAMEDMKPH